MIQIALVLFMGLGSIVSVCLILLVVGLRQGWFDFLSPNQVSADTDCTEYARTECQTKEGTNEYQSCFDNSEWNCIMKGGRENSLGIAQYPLDCNEGARQECSGKGQKCVDTYKKACVSQGGQWVRKDKTIQKLCGQTGLTKRNGEPCPTRSPECGTIQECKFACACDHGFASLEKNREWMVFFYGDENGLNELTEKRMTFLRGNENQKVISKTQPFTVKSFRVGKNVSLQIKSDEGSIITIPLGSTEHRQIHNVSDWGFSGGIQEFSIE